MSEPLYNQKTQGLSGDPVDTFLDRATLQTRAESRRTISNDGNTPTLFVTGTITAKIFARGMAGQINSIDVYFQNTGASGTVIFGFRPFLDAVDEFFIAATVPAGSGWLTVNVQRSWLFDRLIVVIYFLATSTIGVGYDSVPPYDRYDLLTTGGFTPSIVWTAQTARLYLRVTIGAQETEAVPITGTVTVKNVETPIIGGAVVLRPTADTGRVIFVDRFDDSPLTWNGTAGTIFRDVTMRPSDSGASMKLSASVSAILGVTAEKDVSARSGKLALECAFTLDPLVVSSTGAYEEFDIFLFKQLTSGALNTQFDVGFRIFQTDSTLSNQGLVMRIVDIISGTTLASQACPIVDATTGFTPWHHMKGILDIDNKRPVSFVVNDRTLLLPATSAQLVGLGSVAGGEYMGIFVQTKFPVQGGTTTFNVGDVVVTQEP